VAGTTTAARPPRSSTVVPPAAPVAAAPPVGLVEAGAAAIAVADSPEFPVEQVEAAPAAAAPAATSLPRWLSWTLWVTFGLSVIYAFCAATIGWHNTLYSDLHQFRQSQTAITCFYMLRDGFTVNYRTPVLGPDWRVPFEFPIYQWTVVAAVKMLGTALDQTGRGVSLLFFFLTLIPTYLALPALRVKGAHRLIFLIVLLVSPFYVFWSRTFMMETTALFYSASFAACVILYAWRRENGATLRKSGWLVGLAILFGLLGALSKITTLFGFGLGAAIYVMRGHFAWSALRKPRWSLLWRQAALLALVAGPALVLDTLWNRYADAQKVGHPISFIQVHTSPWMVDWCWGTRQQKLDPSVWDRIILARGGMLINYDAAFWLGCLAVVIATRRRWKEVLACGALFLIVPATFTNLHWVHDYYMCANGAFLLWGVAFCILGIFECEWTRARWAGLGALGVTIVVALMGFRAMYYPMMARNNTMYQPIIDAIARNSDPDSVIVYLGFDWDPTLPYYTQRRALMIPDWSYLPQENVAKEIRRLVGYKIGAVLILQPSPVFAPEFVLQEMRSAGLDTSKVIALNRGGGR
jgi:hypothetical protein